MSRTICDFPAPPNLWQAVDAWAAQHNYETESQDGARRVLRKGRGLLVAKRMLSISVDGQNAHVEAWLPMGFIVRMMSFFILPAEIGIESGGFKATLPRRLMREEVNQLMTSLGQPSIT